MRRIISILMIATMALVFTACGGSVPAAPPSIALAVEGLDTFQYNPPTLSMPAGAEVTLTFKNSGGLDHNFVLVSEATDVLSVSEADALGGVNAGTVAAGNETTFTFTAPAVGTYKYVCTIAGHAAGGMVGTLTTSP